MDIAEYDDWWSACARCTERKIGFPAELTNGGDGRYDLAKLKLIQNCSFSSSVQTNHQYSHVSFSEELGEQLRECEPHYDSR